MVMLNRRELLAGALAAGAVAGTAGLGLGGLSAAVGIGPRRLASLADMVVGRDPADGTTGRGPLVLCTLFGGNDGLNTVVPYATGQYVDWRGDLAIPASQALPLGSFEGVDLGFHPSLTGLHALFEAGRVAVISGVEYPNPNFSHFASTTIWQTADPSGVAETGWLGRWLDLSGTDPLRALSIGPTPEQAMVGARQQASTLNDSTSASSQLPWQNSDFMAAYGEMMTAHGGESAIGRAVADAGVNLLAVGSAASDALGHETPPTDPAGRDAGDIGNQLAIVAECIRYGLRTDVYGVGMGSFDTHSDQAGPHASLLGQLDAGVSAFMSDFPTATSGQSPVVLICSEFGRTPRVNASNGTDHSSPSVVLAVGPGVKGGFYGSIPSFTRLDAYGNQIFTTDFRSVYATVLEGILGVEPARVLGHDFAGLGFV